jgi:hypothetical protein
MSVASWLEWMTALHTGALIATFGCASGCGAFADERRVVVAT